MTQTRTDNTDPADLAPPVDSGKIPAHVWRTAFVVVFGAIMGMLDTSLINIGLHTIGADLHAPLATMQWVASGYLLALGVSLTVCGWLARRVGVGRLWLTALAAFTVISAACALADTANWLIALRILQGLAAGVMIPAGQTLLGQAAGPQRMGRVMGVVGVAVVGAPALGPTIGGLMLAHWSWQWLFLINIPLGIIGFGLGLRYLPLGPGTPGHRLDIAGVMLAGGGVAAIVYGLTELGEGGGSVTAVSVWLPMVLGLLALAGFIARAVRSTRPLLDVGMFTNRVFAAANTAGFFAGASMFGVMVLLPLYFQVLQGTSLIRTGLALIAFGAGGAVALPIGGRLTDRYGGGVVAVAGNLVVAITVLPFVFLPADANALLVQPLLFAAGVGTALASTPLVSAAYAAVRPDQLPDATAFVNILQRVGGAIGVAVIAVILSRTTASDTDPITGYHLSFAAVALLSLAAAVASVLLRNRQRA
ncbi:DHA2 family efflux MFS transporter permease subunit [Nocardia huaxiensis]|uniref:DHA2 family efflux MFS transporter permease subunit n=1 Tax=Nocardia huaxiensis TaxID=2755382 RepID=A0A7D6ZH80_9NOCA|nr:DHA2 family efflux MFS transporter permease subunit [Nocardia huaxiensis]QLY29680.1 DHA2 family efflux MFS transporter permease subunit [Nocardia huaxiensis]UFS96747.1 DHA2 family efflux MFS transporter permease subunit [Nocardia huaxiensis]